MSFASIGLLRKTEMYNKFVPRFRLGNDLYNKEYPEIVSGKKSHPEFCLGSLITYVMDSESSSE
jgi:hypothetical protein